MKEKEMKNELKKKIFRLKKMYRSSMVISWVLSFTGYGIIISDVKCSPNYHFLAIFALLSLGFVLGGIIPLGFFMRSREFEKQLKIKEKEK